MSDHDKIRQNLFDLEGKMSRRVMLQGKTFVAEAQKLEGVPYFCHSFRIELSWFQFGVKHRKICGKINFKNNK